MCKRYRKASTTTTPIPIRHVLQQTRTLIPSHLLKMRPTNNSYRTTPLPPTPLQSTTPAPTSKAPLQPHPQEAAPQTTTTTKAAAASTPTTALLPRVTPTVRRRHRVSPCIIRRRGIRSRSRGITMERIGAVRRGEESARVLWRRWRVAVAWI